MKITNLVERILRDEPKTRDSDKELLLEVWDQLGFNLTFDQRLKFKTMPSTETIRRIRQKIQESGKYSATDRINKERQFKALRMQQITPSAKPQYVEQVGEQVNLIDTNPARKRWW